MGIYAQGTNTNNHILELIENNRIAELKKIIVSGYDVNTEEVFNYTPLMYAIDKEKYEVVELLIQNNADLNLCTNAGSPISLAAGKTNFEIVKLLLDNGADINNDFRKRDNSWRSTSAVFAAAVHLNFELFDYLISRGADVNRGRWLEGENTLMAVISNSYSVPYKGDIVHRNETIRMINKLIENGINVNHNAYYGNALTDAAFHNDEEVIDLLLRNGADLNNIIPESGKTTYEYILSLKNPKINEILNKYSTGLLPPQ
jgi:ankyrin repeat protein